MSIYANVAGSFAAFQAAHGEKAQQDGPDLEDVLKQLKVAQDKLDSLSEKEIK